ncbi:hypothetical protein AU210_015976 [Fusarium oxysporum f. sp. radicis-cucumerinum]|uniref:NACHT domain-containing protein n=1 Tax=Fusarium oxysporum f. sp. radicis-cucumerinum TaxID=327505 RepID=A0A2H3G2X7_FUSOX|nr:hypothetical protein AU210_015976 [Fusarium oxysporum f. sp. radicis-cucumerinum]
MSSFTFPRVIARIFVGPQRAVWYIFPICCGLLIISICLSRRRREPSRVTSAPPPAEYPIQILHDDNNATVDIVAVHGLAANPDYAWVWQPKNNPPGHPGYPAKHFNWLKELLPIELSSAQLSCRVMTFNYDSKWFMNAPQQRLSNISDTLLVSLRNKRDKATGRPLIFIGHSFGGNLIEQAIISASRQSGYLEIAESTVGVVFLGTPHRGSAAASWGVLITSLAPPQFTAEKRILKDLEEQSSSLTDRLHDFSRWLFVESVPVVCFFEQLATDYSSRMGAMGQVIPYKELVVPETSACIDGHPKISLHADHFKINKFYGPDDPSFKLVYPEIERMARGAQDILNHHRNPKAIPMDQSATSGDLRTCLQEMRVTNPRDILSEIRSQKGKRIGHTCEWILKREEFSAWGANDNSQLLRLIGSPGIGKTMMSTFLIEALKGKVEKSPDKMFAYFLCDYRYPEQRSPTAILRSLIWQLLLQRNGFFRHIRSDFEKHKDSRLFESLFENFSTLWRIFQDMLRDEHAGEVFILIDALDECDRSTRKALLRCMRELFQASLKSAGNFKFLVTCRPEISDIEYELIGIDVSLRMDSSEVNADLSDYINFKGEDLAQRKGYSQNLKEDVKAALESRAGGTFLWVSLMINELESTPNYEVADKLKDLPEGLDETYTRILEDNIPKKRREDARFLLLSMVAARRPLTKKELAASFAFWKTGSVVGHHDLHDYMDICASCSSIIHLDVARNNGETTANFCHQSVKDFLLNDHGSLSGAWYQMSSDGANLHMFQMCWCYLSSDVFFHGRLVISRRNNMLLKTPIEELKTHLDQYPFLEYASREWEEHAIASYPALLKDLKIDIVKAPILRDVWFLRTAREGHGHEAVFKLLLITEGADVNSKDKNGRTPLSLAAMYGHEGIVKMLLATEGVDMDSKDNDGRTPLSLAVMYEHDAIVKLLLATEGVDMDSKDKNGQTPLSLATQDGREIIVKLLLATEKVDVNSKDKGGDTPLLLATESRHEAIVKMLIATEGIDVNAKDEVYGVTPLSLAAKNGYETIVKLLLAADKDDVDSKDKDGQTPLSLAAENGHKAIVKLLLATEKVDVNSKDKGGDTPLSDTLDAASIKAESGRTTLADLPTVQIGCKRYIPEEYIANKNRKGRRSWIQAYGFFLTEVSPDLRTLQTYWACSKCDERGKSSLFVATNTTSPIEHLRRSHMMTEADGNAYEDSSRADSQPPSKRRCLELPTARSNVNKAKELTVGWIVTANLPFTAPSNPYLRRMLDLHDASLAKEITMRCQGWAKEGRYGALWEVMIGMEYLLNFFEEQKLIFSPPDGTADELQIARASATTRCSPPRADQGRGREKHLPQHTRDEYTGAFSQAESLDDDHRRCIQISINNCWSKLDEYYSLLGQSPLYPAAVILHPRWNVSWLEANWTSHEQLVWLRDAKNSVREFFEQQYPRKEQSEAARTMIGKAMRQDEPSQFDQWMQSYDRYMMEEEDELGVYMRQGPVRRENLNPILWWKEHQEEYPRLSKFALDILAIPAMSVDPERTFSVTKLTISSQRHSLSPEIIEEIQCLRNWLGHQAITVGEVVSFGGDLMGWDGGEA